jgi:hypothetical protein
MSTEPQRQAELERVYSTPPGLGRLAAVNHSVIGLRFIVVSLVFFVIGGLLSMLIRAQLAIPGNEFLDHEAYNQIFTMHGTVMMFLFAIPLIEGLALYFIPKFLGARDLSFPRLSAFGFWCFLFGGSILLMAMLCRRGPGQRLVHVHAAVLGPVFARHQCRCLADRCHLRRGLGDRLRHRTGRHRAQGAHRRHEPRTACRCLAGTS